MLKALLATFEHLQRIIIKEAPSKRGASAVHKYRSENIHLMKIEIDKSYLFLQFDAQIDSKKLVNF